MDEIGPQLDPDRLLALSYVTGRRRAGIKALWQLDTALGAVLSAGREPAISQIKLAWWREALERLDTSPAPAEPLLKHLARDVLPAGITGAELAGLEEGWAILLAQEALTVGELHAYAEGRGRTLFRLSAHLLGLEPSFDQICAGEAWALTDLARHSGEPDAAAAMEAARHMLRVAHWPRALRPIGMLAVLAERDLTKGLAEFEVQGSPARMLRMLRHRFTGR